jgi:hypothetical protein
MFWLYDYIYYKNYQFYLKAEKLLGEDNARAAAGSWTAVILGMNVMSLILLSLNLLDKIPISHILYTLMGIMLFIMIATWIIFEKRHEKIMIRFSEETDEQRSFRRTSVSIYVSLTFIMAFLASVPWMK